MTKFWDGENVVHLKSALQRLDVAIVSARSRPDTNPLAHCLGTKAMAAPAHTRWRGL